MADLNMIADEDINPAGAEAASLETPPDSPRVQPEVKEPAESREQQYAKIFEIARYRHNELAEEERERFIARIKQLEKAMTVSGDDYFAIRALLDPTLLTKKPRQAQELEFHPVDLLYGLYRHTGDFADDTGLLLLNSGKAGRISVTANKIEFLNTAQEGDIPAPFTMDTAYNMVLLMVHNQQIMKSGKGVKINGTIWEHAKLQKAISDVNEYLPEGRKIVIANPLDNRQMTFALGMDRFKSLKNYFGDDFIPSRAGFPDLSAFKPDLADQPKDETTADPAKMDLAPEGFVPPAPEPETAVEPDSADSAESAAENGEDHAAVKYTAEPAHTVEASYGAFDPDSLKGVPFSFAMPEETVTEEPVQDPTASSVEEEPTYAEEPPVSPLENPALKEKLENYLAKNFAKMDKAGKFEERDGIYSYTSADPGKEPVRVYFTKDNEEFDVLQVDTDFLTDEMRLNKSDIDANYADSLDYVTKIMDEEKIDELRGKIVMLGGEIADAQKLRADRRVLEDENNGDWSAIVQDDLNSHEQDTLNHMRYAEFSEDYLNLISGKVSRESSPLTPTASGIPILKYTESGLDSPLDFYMVPESGNLRLLGYTIDGEHFTLNEGNNNEFMPDIYALGTQQPEFGNGNFAEAVNLYMAARADDVLEKGYKIGALEDGRPVYAYDPPEAEGQPDTLIEYYYTYDENNQARVLGYTHGGPIQLFDPATKITYDKRDHDLTEDFIGPSSPIASALGLPSARNDAMDAKINRAAADAIEKGISHPPVQQLIDSVQAEGPAAAMPEEPVITQKEAEEPQDAEAAPEAVATTGNDVDATYRAIKELVVTSPDTFQHGARAPVSKLLDMVNAFAHQINPNQAPLIMDNDELVARLKADNLLQTKEYGAKKVEGIYKIATYKNFVPTYIDGKPAYEENPVYRAVVESLINNPGDWDKAARRYEDIVELVKTHRDRLQYTGSLTEAKMAADTWSHLRKDGIIAVSDAKKTASILSVASGLTSIGRYSLHNAFALAAAKPATPETPSADVNADSAANKGAVGTAMEKAVHYDPDGDSEDPMIPAAVTDIVPEELRPVVP